MPKSENKFAKLTEAHEISDAPFVEHVKKEYVNPLVDEFKELIDGYLDMGFDCAYTHVIGLNEPYFESGDALILPEYEDDSGMLVYAGRKLGYVAKLKNVKEEYQVEQYAPRFKNDFIGGALSNGIATIPGTNGREYESAIKVFLTYERDSYRSLPPSYRAALLVQYICENIVVLPSDATRFVLGFSQEIICQRWIARMTKNGSEIGNGWIVRIRDVKPGKDFVVYLGQQLRSTRDSLIASLGDNSIEDQSFVGKREPKKDANTVYSFIDTNYKAMHIYVGDKRRGNDVSWDDVLRDVQEAFPNIADHYSNGNNLKDSYERNRGKYPYHYRSKAEYKAAQASGGGNHGETKGT